MKPTPKNKGEKKIELAFISCPECQQKAPVIEGKYKIVHDRNCSKDTPSHDWRESLQFEIMEDYIFDAEGLFDDEGGVKVDKMRGHFEKLIAFIEKEIKQARQETLKEVEKIIEGMNKNNEHCEHDQDGACYAGRYEDNLCFPSYNQALSDIKSSLQVGE